MISIEERIVSRIAKIKDTSYLYDSRFFTEPLTGALFHLNAIDMTYLVLELMDEFNVTFDVKDVVDYKFNTIASISKVIEEKISG